MNQLKDVSLWNEDDVAKLPSEEFDWLEFKDSRKLTGPNWEDDLSKNISAWANYEGGYLIFGVANPEPGQQIEIDGGVPLDYKPDLPTWLDQVIPNLVDPPLSKIATRVVTGTDANSKIKPDHALIVIHIPPSESAPHQARDRKYYQRLGRHLVPLRHRAVLDIQSRRKHPKIRASFILHIGRIEPCLFWKLENIGLVMAKHWKAVVQFPTRLEKREIHVENNHCINQDAKEGSFWELRFGTPLAMPLYPGSDVSGIYKIIYHAEIKYPSSTSEIRVTIFADDMPAQKEVFQLADVIKRH